MGPFKTTVDFAKLLWHAGEAAVVMVAGIAFMEVQEVSHKVRPRKAA